MATLTTIDTRELFEIKIAEGEGAFLSLAFQDQASDVQSCLGDEVCGRLKVPFGAPELLCQRSSVWPVLCPCVLV